MSTPIVAFFNNQGGVGKTSLVYHLAWMYQDFGKRVVAVDLDPQAHLTTAFLDEERLEAIWEADDLANTVFRCIQPLIRSIGDIATPKLELIDESLALLVGDLDLSSFEDELSLEWLGCLDGKERSFRIISAFWQLIRSAIDQQQADIVLMDLGSNLGAINRAALIAADYVVLPLSPDVFLREGLSTLGPTLQRWREEWQERLTKNPVADLKLPLGEIQPMGYIVLQRSVRLDRPVKAHQQWMARIPKIYRSVVSGQPWSEGISIANDPDCLALLKHYQSLMPLAQEAGKPMFRLKPADGAIGSHVQAVQSVYKDFSSLAQRIAQKVNLDLKDPSE
jgi:chromosome partitioning protein